MPLRRNNSRQLSNSGTRIGLRKLILFAMLGALMFASKIVMEVLPNIHLIGVLTMVYTLVYRKQALIPIYMFVFVSGLYSGFDVWWVPYLYLWGILWAVTMILPRKMPEWLKFTVYMCVCALHGLLYGTLYAPFQALAFGLDWRGMLAWIVSGFPFDIVHAVGNFVAGLLIVPLSNVLFGLERRFSGGRLANNDKIAP